MDGTRSISISPDGLNLYVAGWDDNAVALFSRDTATGMGSFLGRLKSGEDDIFALDATHFLAVSPDGENVYQGLPNPLANPMLTLYSGSEVLAENDDWGEDSTIKNYKHLRTLARFHWPQVAQNAAMLVTLGQGLYTVILDGGAGYTGIALFEIYVID